MAIITLECPKCGGEIQLDDSREFGFCVYCGAKVMIQEEKQRIEISGSVKFDESEKYSNYLNLANQAFSTGNINEAYRYYTKSLEIKQNDYFPIFRKALCAGYLPNEGVLRTEEMLSGIKRAFDMSSDLATKQSMSSEIVTFSVTYNPYLSTEFYSAEDCSKYINTIYNKIVLLNRLYIFVYKENRQDASQFVESVIQTCSLIKAKSLRFVAGTTVNNGQAQTVYGTYQIPQEIINDVTNIRKLFFNEYNKDLVPQIEIAKQDIEKTKLEISTLPQLLRFSHYFCSWWVALIGFFMCGFYGIGIIVWFAQIIVLLVCNVNKGEYKHASQLYQTLKTQERNLAMLNSKLKK